MVDIDSSALGREVGERAVSSLPLVTRNFTQIAGLSPGVAAGVINAGELGLGGKAPTQIAKSNDGIYVHGARSYDNNFEPDGICVSDVQGSASGSGGILIPNPYTIEEFKVQTRLADAAFGPMMGMPQVVRAIGRSFGESANLLPLANALSGKGDVNPFRWISRSLQVRAPPRAKNFMHHLLIKSCQL